MHKDLERSKEPMVDLERSKEKMVDLERSKDPMVDLERSKELMVLSLDYWEQTGNALKNLFDLQCWASTVNISKVVEPAVFSKQRGIFHFMRRPNKTFSDYFDIDAWNALNFKYRNSVLVNLESFLRESHRSIIFVQMHFRADYELTDPCKSMKKIAKMAWFKELTSRGFEVKTVCIDARFPLSDDMFRKKIFQSADIGSGTSVLFDTWHGISLRESDQNSFRLVLKNTRCRRNLAKVVFPEFRITKPSKIAYPPSSSSPIILSSKIFLHLDNFLSKHLERTGYVAVMVRAERLNRSVVENNATLCIKYIMEDHEKALSVANAKRTLFFTDNAVHGSYSWEHKPERLSAARSFSHYLEEALKPFYSNNEVNMLLESVTNSNDSVLITLLQSALVARADAVVLLGGGSFQLQTLNMYAHNHVGHEQYFFRDSFCRRRYIHHFNEPVFRKH